MNLAHLQYQTTLPDVNVHAKFEKNRSKTTLKLESGNDIFTSIKGHNSVVYKQI